MQIGPHQLSAPICQAGLAGYSDRAMRVVARRRGCPYAVTEALLDIIMLSGGQGLKKSIDINHEDHPVAGQLIGSEPDQMAAAAQILHDFEYDVIDLNFACPVKKIKNRARGGHMLKDAPRARAIIAAVREKLGPRATITISTRRAFDDTPQAADTFEQVLESAWEFDCAAVRVHARTVEQKYQGQSRWPFLKDLKARNPNRTILGSGDIFTAQDAVRMLKETKVDCCWIARGAIGNPFIFNHIRALLAEAPIAPPSLHEQREALSEHFALAMEIHGEQLAGRRMRKIGIKSSRFHPIAQAVKDDFISISSLREWKIVLEKWYASDGPGVWPDPSAADEVNTQCVDI